MDNAWNAKRMDGLKLDHDLVQADIDALLRKCREKGVDHHALARELAGLQAQRRSILNAMCDAMWADAKRETW